MPVCKKCNQEFPNWVKINNVDKNLGSRKYCLECSPFGQHNTQQIHTNKFLDINKYLKNGFKICPKCNTAKKISEFYKRRHNTSASPYCKTCTNDNTVKRQHEFKNKCLQYKGNICEICGYNKYSGALEFHHEDPNKKDTNIAKLRSHPFGNKIKKEIDKCKLLCTNCHREEHYNNKINTIMNVYNCNEEIRYCPRCQSNKSINNFYKRGDNNEPNTYCKQCANNQVTERQKELKEKCVEYKGGKCEICGYDKHKCVLEFHHKNPKEKEFNLSKKSSLFDDNIVRELNKCRLLCGVCHREEHGRLDGLFN